MGMAAKASFPSWGRTRAPVMGNYNKITVRKKEDSNRRVYSKLIVHALLLEKPTYS
jgi:hypothetical protein